MENLLQTPVREEQVMADHLAKAPRVLMLSASVPLQGLGTNRKPAAEGPSSLALDRLSEHSQPTTVGLGEEDTGRGRKVAKSLPNIYLVIAGR